MVKPEQVVSDHVRAWRRIQLLAGIVALLALSACNTPLVAKSATATPTPKDPTAYALTSNTADPGGELLYGINARTGAKLWQASLEGSSPVAPIVVGNVVYAATSSLIISGPGANTSTVYAFDAASGKIKWKQQIQASSLELVTSAPGLLIGTISTPLNPPAYFKDKVIALNAKDGTTAWTVDSDPATYLNPFATTSDTLYVAENQYGQTSKSAILAILLHDGSTVWNLSGGAFKTTSVAEPLLSEGKIIYGQVSGYGEQTSGELVALNPVDGSKLWSASAPVGHALMPIAASPQAIYVFDSTPKGNFDVGPGALSAYDPATGGRAWSVPAEQELADTYSGIPMQFAQTDGQGVYYSSEKGSGIQGAPILVGATDSVVAVSITDGKQLWKDQQTQTVTPPSAANGAVYVGLPRLGGLTPGEQGAVEALNATDGSVMWKLAVQGAALAPIVVGA